MLPGACRRVPLEENLRAFWGAGKPRRRVYRRRVRRRLWRRRPADRHQPPPLLELAPFGHVAQPPRELAARKSKENQGKRLGFPWSNQDFSRGYEEKIRKIIRRFNSPQRLCANAVLDAFSPSLAASDPSIVDLPPQKSIAYVSGFVNELDGGLEVGDPIGMSREACAVRDPLNPGGDQARGSSSVDDRRTLQ
jgi:hypothetical protein